MKFVVLDILAPSPLSFISMLASFSSGLLVRSSLMCSWSVAVKFIFAPGYFPCVCSIWYVLFRLPHNCFTKYDLGKSSVIIVSS